MARGVVSALIVAVVAVVTVGLVHVAAPADRARPPSLSGPVSIGAFSQHPVVIALPDHPASYLGAFVKGVPDSYAPVKMLARAAGTRLTVALYYSGWHETFRSAFAAQASADGVVPFIQIEPARVSLTAIAAGVYDTYLKTFATSVASYGAKTGKAVIIGFGHEMNGFWYPWGYRHVSPAVYVAAWRHIVTVFRQQGADNVTWLWTVNIIDASHGILSPGPWWPGRAYVTWVGIDGYYLKPSWTFASLFGPTIKTVRALTLDPVLIAETGAPAGTGQPAKIANLFAGIRAYGLLGCVWFDARGTQDWRLAGLAALAAFGSATQAYKGPAA